MRSKSRTHITVHVNGPQNKPIECLIKISDIEFARPITEFDSFDGPREFVTTLVTKDSNFPDHITETVAELQALLDSDPNTDTLKKIERTLREILGQMPVLPA